MPLCTLEGTKSIIGFLGLMTCQPLWVILCRLPEKGRKEMKEIVEELKERDREERRTGMKVKKQKKWKHSYPYQLQE